MDDVGILLVDDHAIVRDSLGRRLAEEPGFRVVATAGCAAEAITLAREHEPTVIVMDIDLPGLICFDAVESIMAILPSVRVLFLSASAKDHDIDQALAVGALGYVTKGEPIETLIAAIREVARGGAFFSDEVRSRIIVDGSRPRLSSRGRSRAATLTRREVEVLRYLARGMSKKDIAETMSLALKTVESHTQNIMRKLDIHDRVELARFAIREGLGDA